MSTNPLELIIFDWDGTLMDSSCRIVSCLQNAAEDVELKVPDAEQARQVIGLNLQDCLLQLFGEISQDQSKQYIERYRHHFYHPRAHEMEMFPGVLEGLKQLDEQGFLLAVATGKGRRGLDPILKQYDLLNFFCVTRCADEAMGKPHPQMLYDILEFTGMDVQQAIMVGDTTYDLQMASNAGMQALAMEYGMHNKSQLAQHKPAAYFSNFPQLMTWLLDEEVAKFPNEI